MVESKCGKRKVIKKKSRGLGTEFRGKMLLWATEKRKVEQCGPNVGVLRIMI